MPNIRRRPFRVSPQDFSAQWHPVVREIYASRLTRSDEVDKHLRNLQSPHGLPDLNEAAQLMMQSIAQKKTICIYGDYDVDGATATALMVRVLQRLGAKVSYFIPNRQLHGYGLSIAGLQSLQKMPDVVLTVDNGIRSHEAAEYLRHQGIPLIITDHHEPGDTLPTAAAVVNPKRCGNEFALSNLAGVGVAFYLLTALRRYYLDAGKPFSCRLTDYLDLVALGTMADVVPLDFNNRILAQHGIARIQSGQGNMGIRALCSVANVDSAHLTASDISFAIAPRMNAIGRLADMNEGVALLLTDDWVTAQEYAQQFDEVNRERKALESEMTHLAIHATNPKDYIVSAYLEEGHEGVSGIVASRLKTHFSRPALVATDADCGKKIKASLRSIHGVDIHALLEMTAQQLPAGMIQFGGHTMAAGLSVEKPYYQEMVTTLNQAFQQHIGTSIPKQPIYVDGTLTADLLQIGWAKLLEKLEPWGAGLPVPTFCNCFQVLECRKLGARHTRLILRHPESRQQLIATWFFHLADFNYGDNVKVVYQVQVNRFLGSEQLNLLITYADMMV